MEDRTTHPKSPEAPADLMRTVLLAEVVETRLSDMNEEAQFEHLPTSNTSSVPQPPSEHTIIKWLSASSAEEERIPPEVRHIIWECLTQRLMVMMNVPRKSSSLELLCTSSIEVSASGETVIQKCPDRMKTVWHVRNNIPEPRVLLCKLPTEVMQEFTSEVLPNIVFTFSEPSTLRRFGEFWRIGATKGVLKAGTPLKVALFMFNTNSAARKWVDRDTRCFGGQSHSPGKDMNKEFRSWVKELMEFPMEGLEINMVFCTAYRDFDRIRAVSAPLRRSGHKVTVSIASIHWGSARGRGIDMERLTHAAVLEKSMDDARARSKPTSKEIELLKHNQCTGFQ